jgi:hypothetical protein
MKIEEVIMVTAETKEEQEKMNLNNPGWPWTSTSPARIDYRVTYYVPVEDREVLDRILK